MYKNMLFIIGVMMGCGAYGAAQYHIASDGRLVYVPGEKMVSG